MTLASRWQAVLVGFGLSLIPGAYGSAALSVTPSTTWLGDDGTWSPVQIRVGTPPQWTYLLVSTASAETWIIGEGGCDGTALCSSMRGGLFNESQSSTWKGEGFYELGLDQALGFGGYGDYGMDTLTFGTTGVTLSDSIVSSVNTTEYWLGFFGLGIVPGNFSTFTAISAISGLVETEGAIPSHSYGYTAGASYQLKGEPVSLTLGGYDANRFIPHNISFQLDPSQQPQVYIDAISVSSSNSESNNWSTPTSLLSSSDQVYATIDSSTPYLWLPTAVCDRFAASLGLSYNDSLQLYTFDSNSSQHTVLEDAGLTFTFNLSDYSESVNVVTIALPYGAFDLQLSYPYIANTSYGTADSSKYYFPLKRASGANQYTIGRAFLQEAYIITDYERNNFSVHQAVHTEDPIGNTSIVDISRFTNTTLSGSPSTHSPTMGLQTGAVVGIVVGSVIGVTLLAILFFCLRSRRQRNNQPEDEKDLTTRNPPESFLGRMFRRNRSPDIHETSGSSVYPTEMATESHERYELPASLPLELESGSNTIAEDRRSSIETQDLSSYERARLKHEHQQQLAHSQFPYVYPMYPREKTESEANSASHYDSPSIPDVPSPLSSPAADGSHAAFSVSGNSTQPSPVSPAFRVIPSGAQGAPVPPPISPPPTYRRMSPGNAVYVGRMPSDTQLPDHVPRVVGIEGRTLETATEAATSTLGSHYTEDERETMSNIYDEDSIEVDNSHHTTSEHDTRSAHTRGPNWPLDEDDQSSTRIIGGRVVGNEDESKFRMEDMQALRADMQTREATDPYRNRRRLDGEDLVHVPVPAENRFSWESGRDV
ncbi:hypothetical protein BP6252_08662 [Coleophoma cylindrospora]|uniref:Peptidase A1 domain-containing protein n=1 Tax=Coleophoma cylindrospora TaxID=1849047 RepID=A0A3D8R6G4_9HELO|nr:hypothetical protein BP6252_08662 [Coleophoma cylindrospora]